MDQKKELVVLIKELEKKAGTLPLTKRASDIVPGEGNPQATIVFIGEAAGYWESVQRRPFVGQAGELLNANLKTISLKREDVYITNVLKVRPPDNRDPKPEEVEAFTPFLKRELQIIKPKVVVTLGRFSLNFFLPDAKISKVHGQARWVDFDGGRFLLFPLYHPAAALRASFIKAEFETDIKKLPPLLITLKELGKRTVPTPPSANAHTALPSPQLKLL